MKYISTQSFSKYPKNIFLNTNVENNAKTKNVVNYAKNITDLCFLFVLILPGQKKQL